MNHTIIKPYFISKIGKCTNLYVFVASARFVGAPGVADKDKIDKTDYHVD